MSRMRTGNRLSRLRRHVLAVHPLFGARRQASKIALFLDDFKLQMPSSVAQHLVRAGLADGVILSHSRRHAT
jgi:hypothetical protein